MKVLMCKSLGKLEPTDDEGAELLRGLKQGQLVSVEIKRPRNIAHHQMYWALVQLVHEGVDNQAYPTKEDLHNALKIAAGIRQQLLVPGIGTVYVPGSISFGRMDQTTFDKFFDDVCDVVARDFIPGIDAAELRREVEAIIAPSPSMVLR